jgi:ribosome-associated protein
LFEMAEGSSLTDWFVVCEAENPVHARALTDAIVASLKDSNTRPHHVEGGLDGRWILIDFLDVVVHVMVGEVRDYYEIDELWAAGGKRTDIPGTGSPAPRKRTFGGARTPQPAFYPRRREPR